MKPIMYCPSHAAGEGLLRSWVKWVCRRAMCFSLACTPCAPLTSAAAACVFVCDGALLLCQHIPQSDGSALAALQRGRSPSIPSSQPTDPKLQWTAWCQAGRREHGLWLFFVLQSGKTLLKWWMEWRDRRLHNHLRGIKYGCPYLAPLRKGR